MICRIFKKLTEFIDKDEQSGTLAIFGQFFIGYSDELDNVGVIDVLMGE